MAPTFPKTRLAQVPRQIPKAVHSSIQVCQQSLQPKIDDIGHFLRQVMTRAPRIAAGAFSAAKTGTVLALAPIPMPKSRRQTNS